MEVYSIRRLSTADRAWLPGFWTEYWGSDVIIVHGEVFRVTDLQGFVAEQDLGVAGLATYQIKEKQCELISLDSLNPGQGIGTALVEAVRSAAQEAGCTRLFLSTTNDNLDALRFYQRRGFSMYELRRGAVQAARQIKPSIPLLGDDGIPIQDEIELEMHLDQS